METDHSHITVILDRSGSMSSIQDDTIGGFNNFLEQQKSLTTVATLSLIQFDSQDPYEVIHHFTPLDQVPLLAKETYIPRASTPLLDALGQGIQHLQTQLAELAEEKRPSRVLFVVVTDGMENASHRFQKADIETMIQTKTTHDHWQFIFLSAYLGAIHEARNLGFQEQSTLMYQKSAQGSRQAWASLSQKMLDVRQVKQAMFSFDHTDRKHPDDPFLTSSQSKGKTVVPLWNRNDHLFLEQQGALWLIDTGAPTSFGRPSRLELAGKWFHLETNYLGLTPEALTRTIGTPCVGLLGADVLGQFDHVFDLAAGTLSLSTDPLPHPGEPISLTDFLGIPILKVRIAARDFRMFFDTGAAVSYLQDAVLSSFPEAGTITDFYPGFGVFQTNSHHVEVGIGQRTLSLRCGTLPDLLGITLLQAGTQGIVGYELLRYGPVGYFPRRRQLVL